MKVEKIISIVDAVKTNSVNDDTKLAWINDVEGRVACEIHKKSADEFKSLVNGEEELSIPEPYSRMYTLYLIAMIALVQGEFDLHSKAFTEYELAFSEYARYSIRNR
ncbi:MAG: hypothetical protein E7611_06910 [Ruminococcaceae bacterium]|nr:hypothetical protein [Oscillospiraceae bacterium]